MSAPPDPTGDFWLSAHDGIKNARLIGDWSLGIGLATGLLAELVHGGWCQLWGDRLLRMNVKPPTDPVLRALLDQMQVDEKDWPPLPRQPRPAALPPQTSTYRGVHALPEARDYWPPETQAGSRQPPVPEQTRPPGPGHDLREYLSWLAYEDRADELVSDRLARDGRVRREMRRRVFGGTTVRYVPVNMNVTGFPASRIRTSVQHGLDLSWSERFLAGLFLTTGLDQHALATLSPPSHRELLYQLKKLDKRSRALLKAADVAVSDAAIR